MYLVLLLLCAITVVLSPLVVEAILDLQRRPEPIWSRFTLEEDVKVIKERMVDCEDVSLLILS